MSPDPAGGSFSPGSFPRVSGDEPGTAKSAYLNRLFSPRERG